MMDALRMSRSFPTRTATLSRTSRTTASTALSDKQIINKSIDISFGLIVVILNVVEIIILSRLKRKKKIYEIFILSLSVADLLFGFSNAVLQSVTLTRRLRDRSDQDDALEISYTIYFLFVLNSIFHLVWIAADRAWVVFKPFHHRSFVTRKTAVKLVACAWFLSTTIALSLFLSDQLSSAFTSNSTEIIQTYENVTGNTTDSSFSTTLTTFTGVSSLKQSTSPLATRTVTKRVSTVRKEYGEHTQLILAVFIVIADVALISLYAFIIVWLKKKSMASHKVGESNEDKMSIICAFIAATFVVFTLPYALARFIVGHIPLWANLMLVVNSGLNSVVYFFRGKCQRYQEKLRKKYNNTSSGVGGTPLTSSKKNLDDEAPLSSIPHVSTHI